MGKQSQLLLKPTELELGLQVGVEFDKNLDMDQLYQYLQGNELYYPSYVHELFPGMHLLPKNKVYPTIVLFYTGSFTLMGSKDLDCIFESESFVERLIKQFDKTKNRGYLKDPSYFKL